MASVDEDSLVALVEYVPQAERADVAAVQAAYPAARAAAGRPALRQETRPTPKHQAAAGSWQRIRAALVSGDPLVGTVTRRKPYGLFVDLDGVTGLLHISQLVAQGGKLDPFDILEGERLMVYVLSTDEARGRVRLAPRKPSLEEGRAAMSTSRAGSPKPVTFGATRRTTMSHAFAQARVRQRDGG
jgi:predicted RNA-binding protein with RPS1 domain